MRPSRLAFGLVALPLLAGVACEDSPVIAEREEVVHRFVDIRNVSVPGQGRLVFAVTVPGDAIHPHIEGRWTVANVERPVDAYVFRASEYDPSAPPGSQAYYWTSTVAAGSGIGQSRTNEVHIHASAGDWLVVFFNPGLNPLTSRTDLSAEVENNFFR